MAECPACRRPVAMARAKCVYCGAPLSEEAVAEAARSAAAAEALAGPRRLAVARVLLVVDWSTSDPVTYAKALELPSFEARLKQRRGGLSLQCVLDATDAGAEEARLRAAGVRVFAVPEARARLEPWVALSGAPEESALRLRGDGGVRRVEARDVLLVVRGPIAREYQAKAARKRIETARLDEGYRFHLHLRSGSQPVEIDPAEFDFRESGRTTGSSLLELSAWVDELGAATDDGFRHLTPALGPAAPNAGSAVRALARPESRAKDQSAVLENLAQFRFYSGWRAAVERARLS